MFYLMLCALSCTGRATFERAPVDGNDLQMPGMTLYNAVQQQLDGAGVARCVARHLQKEASSLTQLSVQGAPSS